MTPTRVWDQLGTLFEENSPFEQMLRVLVVVGVLSYVLFFGSVFEAHYPTRLVELYAYPWWRLLIVLLVALGAWWCPRVGLALAAAAFFYLNDMSILTSPFLTPQTK